MEMKLVSLKDVPKEIKAELLQQLGYNTDGTYVLDKKGEIVKDKYIDVDIKISNMLILPGSTIILDNNPLSIAAYLEEYSNDL
jgi:hypothetical protein